MPKRKSNPLPEPIEPPKPLDPASKDLTVVPPKKSVILNQLQSQYNLPLDEAMKLIRTENQLTKPAAQMAIDQARIFGVPLQGINVIPSRNGINIYINADGIQWLLQQDPRGVKSIQTQIAHNPSKDEPFWAIRAVVTMYDGASYDGHGAVVIDANWNFANALMKAETKAIRRASYRATGKTLPIYDEVAEWKEESEAAKDVSALTRVRNQDTETADPTSIAELLTWMQPQYNGITDLMQIGIPKNGDGKVSGLADVDVAKTVEFIKAQRPKTPEKAEE